MDETSLRTLLERAASAEPPAAQPLGRIIAESRKTGRRLRWRRRIEGSAACVAAVAVIAAASMFAAGHAHRPSAADTYDGSPGMAYVTTENGDLVPVNLATFRAERPIKTGKIYVSDIIASRGDKTLYLSSADGRITPISTATDTVGRGFWVAGLGGYDDVLAATPNGKFAYAVAPRYSQSAPDGATRIDLLTGTASKELRLPPGLSDNDTAVAASNKTVMLTGFPEGKCVGANGPNHTCYTTIEVSLINVATQRAQKPVSFSTSPSIPYDSCVAMSPDGETAFVAYSKTWSSQNYDVTRNTPLAIVPIDVATDKPLKPMRLPRQANGLCSMAVAANGRTAYVLTGRYVTPVDLVTGTAEKPIRLTLPCWRAHPVVRKLGKRRFVEHVPAGCDSTSGLALDPDGRMAYVTGTAGLTPVDLATNTALPTIRLNAEFVSFTPNGKTALAGVETPNDPSSYKLLSIQAATGKVGNAIRLPGAPAGIVVAPSVPVALGVP